MSIRHGVDTKIIDERSRHTHALQACLKGQLAPNANFDNPRQSSYLDGGDWALGIIGENMELVFSTLFRRTEIITTHT